MRWTTRRMPGRKSWRLFLEPLEDRSLLSTSIPLNPTYWTELGPNHITNCQTTGRGACSGRLTSIAAHPTDADTIYVGSAGGGVWKTTDGGAYWTPLTDYYGAAFIGAVTLAPSNPDIVYVATGEANYGPSKVNLNRENIYYGYGMLRSEDGGASWQWLGQSEFYRRAISKIVVHPRDPNTVYVAVGAVPVNGVPGNMGVWKTTDAGATWALTTANLNLGGADAVSDLQMAPTDPEVLYAAVGNPRGGAANGVYKTTDGGQSWTAAGNFPSGAFDTRMGRISIAIAPSAPNILHAAIAGSGVGGGLGLYRQLRSVDGGQTWTSLTGVPNYMSGSGDYMNVLAIDPSNPSLVYASGLDIYSSPNGGSTWNDIDTGTDGQGPHVDHHAFAFDARGRLLDGNDGGIWRLENPQPGQLRWSNLNTNLATLQFVGVAQHPTNPDFAMGGLQDNGTVIFQDSLVWRHIHDGDGGYSRIDYSDPQIRYHTYQYTTGGFLRRTDNGGQNWQARINGINTSDPAKFYQPYVIHPTTPTRLLLGTNRVYETTNRGNNWAPISQTFQNGWTVNNIIDAVAPSASDPNTIYASAGGRIFVTYDRGAAWTETNPIPPQTGLRFTDIKVDPNYPWVAFATSSSFSDLTGGGRFWATFDFGATWYDLTGNLWDVPAWTLAVDWGEADVGDEVFYLGTDMGVWTMSGYNGDWQPMGYLMPYVQVHELELNPKLGILSAATHGRGMWQIEVGRRSAPGPLVSPTKFSGDLVTALQHSLTRPSTIVQEIALPTLSSQEREFTPLDWMDDLARTATAPPQVAAEKEGHGTAASIVDEVVTGWLGAF